MKNVISISILNILFSFILLTSFIFLFNNIFTEIQFKQTINYILHENRGIFIFFSQFLFIISKSKKNNFSIILNVLICWALYNLLSKIFIDDNSIRIIKTYNDELFIDRSINNSLGFSITNMPIVKQFLIDIESWDLTKNSMISSFVILLFNSSFLSYIYKHFKGNIILKTLFIFTYFIFLVLFWDLRFNIPMFLGSIILLKRRFNND